MLFVECLTWLVSFYSQVEVSFRLALTLYFESLYLSGFERKVSERELLYVFLLVREECIWWVSFMGVIRL